jgi:hypothetical protein
MAFFWDISTCSLVIQNDFSEDLMMETVNPEKSFDIYQTTQYLQAMLEM